MSTTPGAELTVGSELMSVALRHARDAEIFFAREESVTAGIEGANELPSSRREGEGMALRVISGGRIGFAVHLGPLAGLQPSALLKEAVRKAAHGPEAPPTFYKDRESSTPVFTWDDRVAALGPDQLRRLVRQVDLRLGDLLGNVDRNVVARRTVRHVVLLSRTSEKRSEKTLMQLRVATSAPSPSAASFVEVWASCQAPDDPMGLLGAIAWKAALARESAVLDAGARPVLLGPRAAGTVLRWACAGFLGPRLVKGSSPLASRLDERLFDERITLLDDPTLPWNPAGGGFDGEGVLRRRNLLVEQGVVKGYLLDLASAWKLGLEPTGSAARTMDMPPVAAPAFLDLVAGDRGFDDLLALCEGGVYVDALDEDAVPDETGDFTCDIREGFLIEGRRPGAWLTGLAVQGNVYSLLNSHVLGVGGDVVTGLGSRCGSLALRDVSLVPRPS